VADLDGVITLLAGFVVVELIIIAVCFATSRGWIGGGLFRCMAVGLLVGGFLVAFDSYNPVATLSLALVAVVTFAVGMPLSSYIGAWRKLAAELAEPPVAVPASDSMNDMLAIAHRSGFALVPEGVVEAVLGRGQAAVVVQPPWHVAEILVAKRLVVVTLASARVDGGAYISSNLPKGAQVSSPDDVVQHVPGATFDELVEAHRQVSSRHAQRGVLRRVASDDALSFTRSEQRRSLVLALERPWQSTWRVLRAWGLRSYFLGAKSPTPVPGEDVVN
jgi:hypothetical protein